MGNGNPLQYSCLGNPLDRGVWQAIVHGGAKSQTRPSMHAGGAGRASLHAPSLPGATPGGLSQRVLILSYRVNGLAPELWGLGDDPMGACHKHVASFPSHSTGSPRSHGQEAELLCRTAWGFHRALLCLGPAQNWKPSTSLRK